jgi:hypothetical protein
VTRVGVYIGTTDGPVQIERISNEPVDLTEVFVGRDISHPLPISDAYESFVQRGRPVERLFGPFEFQAFRMDLSAPVNSGDSWQLAALVAHGLAKASRLANSDDEPKEIVWLTGRVDADGRVGAVGHIDEKFRASREFLNEQSARGIPPKLYVPAEDENGLDPPIQTVRIVEVATVLDELGVSYTGLGRSVQPAAIKTQPRYWLWGSATVAALILAVSLWQNGRLKTVDQPDTVKAPPAAVASAPSDKKPEAEAKAPKPTSSAPTAAPVATVPPVTTPVGTAPSVSTPVTKEPAATKAAAQLTPAIPSVVAPTVSISILEQRPPDGRTCAAVHFGTVKAVQKAIGTSDSPTPLTSSARGVCGVRVRIEVSDGSSSATAVIRIISGVFVGQSPGDETIPVTESVDRTFDIPALLSTPIVYEVEVKAETKTVALLRHSISP